VTESLPRDELDLAIPDPQCTYRIGLVGAGGIVTGSHLPAYAQRSWQVSRIASRTGTSARAAAAQFGIPFATDDWHEVVAADDVDVVDISLPVHLQPEVCRAAFAAGKHVLVQKPMALDLATAKSLVEEAEAAGVILAVNQNGRFDPSVRAAKALIDKGIFGRLVLATMELRTRQPWQTFWASPLYPRLMVLGMSIHHLDQYRMLFGEPVAVTCVTSRYPDQEWPGESIASYTLHYPDGMLAMSLDDGFPWLTDWSVTWRIEGTEAIARGQIGWPTGGPSQIEFTTVDAPSDWVQPVLSGRWFPDAFAGTMGALFDAIAHGHEPSNSGRDNLKTLRLVEACYLSAAERRTISIEEIPL
jgi:predicted dehydrogenase